MTQHELAEILNELCDLSKRQVQIIEALGASGILSRARMEEVARELRGANTHFDRAASALGREFARQGGAA